MLYVFDVPEEAVEVPGAAPPAKPRKQTEDADAEIRAWYRNRREI
jgi:hypothetical protein